MTSELRGDDSGRFVNRDLRYASERSIQPVLKSQTRHLRKVHRVSRQQRGVVLNGDAGDLQILSADAHALRAELLKARGSFGVP